jgi:hypothetical protein
MLIQINTAALALGRAALILTRSLLAACPIKAVGVGVVVTFATYTKDG